MKRAFEFLFMFAGLCSGIMLILSSYTEWFNNLISFINKPSVGSALITFLWFIFAGISTYLTSKMLGD